MNHSISGVVFHTTHFYATQDASPPDDLAGLGDYVKGQLVTFGKPAMASVHSITSLTIIRADNWETGGLEYVTGMPVVGTLSSITPLPHQVSAVIAHKTQLRGRSYQGRTFWPGLFSAMVTGDNLTPAQQALYKTFFDALIAPSTAGSGHPVWEACIASFFHNRAMRSPNGVATPIQSNVVRPRVGTQRRRLQ